MYMLTDITRIPPSSVDPTIKNYHWMDLVTGMLDAYEQRTSYCFIGR